MEIWLPTRFPKYEISSQGRVRRGERILKLAFAGGASTKYLAVTPSVSGRKVTAFVHHLVLEAFVGPRPEGLKGLHRDDDRTNNTPGNLYWGTASNNEFDKVRNGNHRNAKKTECPRGHPLAEPNLVPWYLVHGQRRCLACSRAISYVNNVRPDLDLQEVADGYYARITRALS